MESPLLPYELTFKERDGYLYALIRADSINRNTALAYLREVAAKCAELRCRRLVLERDIPVMLSDADLFFTTNDFLGMMRNVRIAFLNPHAELSEDMDFAMAIATNRGAQFRMHNDLAQAEEWLRDPDARPPG